MKRFFKIVFFVSLALVLFFGAVMVATAVTAMNDNSESVGIIGGADGPTAILITQTLIFNNPVFLCLCLIAVLLVVSAIGWLVTARK